MNEQASFRGQAQLLTRNWRILLGVGLLGVVGLLLTLLSLRGGGWSAAPILAAIGALAMFTSPFLIAYVWLSNPQRRRRSGELRAGADGVHWNGKLLLARRAIVAGFSIPHEDGVLVQLERRFRRPVELIVPTAIQGRQVLKCLGLDASQSLASVPLRSLAQIDWRRFIPGLSLAAMLPGAAILGGLLGPTAASLSVFIGLFGLCAGVVMLNVKARATIGTDGILVSHLLSKHFYRYADIARVMMMHHGYKTVILVMKEGVPARLPIPRDWTDEQERAATRRLAERIENAMAEQRAAPGEADLQTLARKGRPAREWLAHLKTIGAGANADHRRAPVPVDRLWRIVEDTTLAAEERAAAAIALGSAQDHQAQARLRAVAQNTAAPRLRIALEAAASVAELAAEEEAIAALERVAEK